MNNVRHLLLIASLSSLYGCGIHKTVPLASPIDQPPAMSPFLDDIHVFINSGLRDHSCLNPQDEPFITYELKLGPASARMFELAFSGLSRNVEMIKTDPSSPQIAKSAYWVEVNLSSFDGCDSDVFYSSVYVEYEGVLRSEDSDVIARWNGDGRAHQWEYHHDWRKYEYGFSSGLSRLTMLAMRRAAADFVVSFLENKDVNNWAIKREHGFGDEHP